MNYIIFGGSGFIGTHLIHLLKSECVKSGDKIYDLDIVMPGEEGVVPGIVEKNDGVEYIRLDVRKPIEFDFEPTKDDVIFNLAAVHRTPGHPDHAYFETNIYGAENVTAFAEKHGIRKMPGSTCPGAVSGRRMLWCWDTVLTSGSTSRVFTAGSRRGNTSGIPTGSRRLYGSMTGRSPTRTIRP